MKLYSIHSGIKILQCEDLLKLSHNLIHMDCLKMIPVLILKLNKTYPKSKVDLNSTEQPQDRAFT